jgi:hypothetical protein
MGNNIKIIIKHMKFIRKHLSQLFSNLTKTSDSVSNGSTTWGTKVDTNFQILSPNEVRSMVWDLSNDSLTSINSSVNASFSLDPSPLLIEKGSFDLLLLSRQSIFQSMVDMYLSALGPKDNNRLILPETGIQDRIHNMHQLIGTPLDLNHYLDHPNELLSLLNRICKDTDLDVTANSINHQDQTLNDVSSTYLHPTTFQSLGSAVEEFYSSHTITPSVGISIEDKDMQLQAYYSTGILRFPDLGLAIDGLSTILS